MARNNKKVVVVIPIHSETPSKLELISFQQCYKVLGKHPIRILAPEGLNLNKYKAVVPVFEVVFIDPIWQSSVEKYNKLKLSQFFYKLFADYEFLLTYELDAFVFKDELLHWCNKAYDYIGAPWFVGFDNPTDEFLGVGNSGFSLRNVKVMQRAIKKIYIKESAYHTFGKTNKLAFKLSTWLNYLRIYWGENYTIQLGIHKNEDAFIAEIFTKEIKDFKIAPIEEALQFAFEVKPEYLYEINHEKLPMGCHAWWKYNFEFWKPFMQVEGYML
ncbi:DUF5672 family protein [Flavobacterium commune]|uniref:DUF5672 domain-containing protein n=1 Tax=Flavobacterium commune TaxID=1306519 RepID=A0A1D9P7G9_9FLAO|nr:DUF5672 family protein [Flavobacterium commune]AOZ98518.1 hypothetical protein BIW12_03200 [Flavobacterium commune]